MPSVKRVGISIFLMLALAGLPASMYGQQVFGSIYGTVSDSTGGRVPNAKIVIIDDNKGNQYEVSTNEDGNYSKDRLIPGSYTVTLTGVSGSITHTTSLALTVQ